MIPNNYKTSLNIAGKQLPTYIAEYDSYQRYYNGERQYDPGNYENFITFLEAYYEWLAETGNVEERAKNLLNYKDIDNTLTEFEQFFYNEFLKFFPEESLADKRELVKLSKEFYRRKSTTAAFKFLFRALYGTDCHLYNTRESILIASDGKWVQSYFVRIKTSDTRYLNLKGLKIFGVTSKASAIIEKAYFREGILEIQISEVNRNFFSGEQIKIVNYYLKDVYFDSNGKIVSEQEGEILTEKLLGNIEKIEVDPNNKGLFYRVNDPVIFVGGINPIVESPVEANAFVSQVSSGFLKSLDVVDGSNGFDLYPNTEISIIGQNGAGAEAKVTEVDTSNLAIIYFAGVEIIQPYENVALNGEYGFPKMPNANSETKIIDALELLVANSYPISKIQLTNGGTGFIGTPFVSAESYIKAATTNKINVKDLGILCPPRIIFGGFNYANNELLSITGGDGIGAFGKISSVDANGTIQQISYYQDQNFLYPYGGMGYNNKNLPTVGVITQNNKIINYTTSAKSLIGNNKLTLDSVANLKVGMYVSGNNITNFDGVELRLITTSSRITEVNNTTKVVTLSNALTGNNSIGDSYQFNGEAILQINSILGDGEVFDVQTDIAGQIQKITLENSGQDYISQPEVFLDIVDYRVSIYDEDFIVPERGTKVYRSFTGDQYEADFTGKFYNILPTSDSTYFIIRIYSYRGNPSSETNQILYIGNKRVLVDDNASRDVGIFSLYKKGVRQFGNGRAKANATFNKGSVYGNGKYLNTDGFLSSDKVLENEIYNDFTYFLTVDKAFSIYKEAVKNILHPGGTQVIGRNSLKIKEDIIYSSLVSPMRYIEMKEVTYPLVYGELANTNTLQIYNLNENFTGVTLSQVLSKNTYISLYSTNKEKFYAKIRDYSDQSNTITFYDEYFLDYANIAYGYVSSNTIIVTELTNKYDLINNGVYQNPYNKFSEMAYANDIIYISGNTPKEINSIEFTGNSWIITANAQLTNIGNESNTFLISVTRKFVANSIILDYSELEYKYLMAFGTTVNGTQVDGFNIQTEEGYNILVKIGAGFNVTEQTFQFIGVDGEIVTTENGITKISIPPL